MTLLCTRSIYNYIYNYVTSAAFFLSDDTDDSVGEAGAPRVYNNL